MFEINLLKAIDYIDISSIFLYPYNKISQYLNFLSNTVNASGNILSHNTSLLLISDNVNKFIVSSFVYYVIALLFLFTIKNIFSDKI